MRVLDGCMRRSWQLRTVPANGFPAGASTGRPAIEAPVVVADARRPVLRREASFDERPTMKFARIATAAALVAASVAVPATAAQAHGKALGTRSLVSVLTAGKVGFDRNPQDFDILTAAVQAVLAAKPSSAVGVLADGTVALTAFLPTDRAFEKLAGVSDEQKAFSTVAGLGIDTVEQVLLYHVVPGATIDRKAALKANGAALTTAQGGTVKVSVSTYCWYKSVTLIDKDSDARNPKVVTFDINKGNQQIAHSIDRVLRPVDLP
jgi:uncharacterized surface protein with fasciclin (FAS1) repeats